MAIVQLSFFPQPEHTWLGEPALRFEGTLGDVVAHLPLVARMPFVTAQMENPAADLIVRLPQEPGEAVVPLAMVSKGYGLVTHHEVVRTLQRVLAELFDLDPERLPSKLTHTRFGERVHLQVTLPDQPRHQPGHGPVALQVHCINSVDRSASLQIRLGWFWFACANGMFLGAEKASVRRMHSRALQPGDIAPALREQLGQVRNGSDLLSRWHTQPITPEKMLNWVDGKVKDQWGVYAAARVWHIAATGFDGHVRRISTKAPPSQYEVSNDVQVPGLEPVPVADAFAASQALSWVATHESNVQNQIDRMADVHGLVDALISIATDS